MSSTNKTTYYELSQYVGSDKPTYLGDYNSDMLKIDTGLHAAADSADRALTTANAANSAATSASTTASTALSTAQTASTTASQAQTTAETALTNSGAAQSAAEEAETAARANVITNLAPAYDSSLTYDVGDLVTYVDAQGSGKLYKCIVAVTTPEAFNINKWDDKTTSEVFDESSEIISTFVTDGSLTYGDMIAQFCRAVYDLPYEKFMKARYFYTDSDSLSVRNIYRTSERTANLITFSNIYGNASSMNIGLFGCSINNEVYTPFESKLYVDTTTPITYSQSNLTSPIAIGRTYYLVI